jgi:hypothetical protein
MPNKFLKQLQLDNSIKNPTSPICGEVGLKVELLMFLIPM